MKSAVSPAKLAFPWPNRTKAYVDSASSGASSIGRYSMICEGETPSDATVYRSTRSSGLEPSRPSTNEYWSACGTGLASIRLIHVTYVGLSTPTRVPLGFRSGRYGTKARRILAARLMMSSSLGRDRMLNVWADSEKDLVLRDASTFWKGSEKKWTMDLAVDEYRVASLATSRTSQV